MVDPFWLKDRPLKSPSIAQKRLLLPQSTVASTKEGRRKLLMGVVTTLAERACCSEGETRKFLNFLDPLFVEGTMFNSSRAVSDDQERGNLEKQTAEKKRSHGKKKSSPGPPGDMLITTQLTQVDGQDVPFLIGNPPLPTSRGNQKRKLPSQYGAPTTKIAKAGSKKVATEQKRERKQRMESMFMRV